MERVATDFMGAWDSGACEVDRLLLCCFNSNTVKINEADRFDMMCDRNTEPYRAPEMKV
jgi:hypothetical protein